MRPEEVRNYLGEVERLLAPEGVCLATFFILNEVQAELHSKGLCSLNFQYGDENWRYAIRGVPELAIAHGERDLIGVMQEKSLLVKKIHYGTWTGRQAGISYQDMVLLTHG